MTEQQYKTADGSIWEGSRTEFSGGLAFKLISSPDGIEVVRVLSLNEVIRSYGAISFYDPEQERRDAVTTSMMAAGLLQGDNPTANDTRVRTFLSQLERHGYAVMQEDEC